MAGPKGVKRTEAQKLAISQGKLDAALRREAARQKTLDSLKEWLPKTLEGGIVAAVSIESGILCRTPHTTAMLMALPLSPIRLLSIPGWGGGETLHDAYQLYLENIIVALTDTPAYDRISLIHRVALASLVGVITYLAIQFIKELGEVAPG